MGTPPLTRTDGTATEPPVLLTEEVPPEQMAAALVPTAMPPQYLYRIPEAMRLLAMSRSVIYEQIRAGRLHVVKQGRSTRVPAIAIQEYVKLLMTESERDELGQTA